MRLRVTFAIPFGSRVAYDYPHHLGAMVYTLLGHVAPDLSARLHAKGLWTDQSRPYKLFTFSQLWGGPGTTKATRQGLVFDTEKLQWRFDAAADMVTTLLADALLAAERVRIGSLDAAVREIATEKEPDFAAQPLALTALSPLVASVFSEELATRYADPKDDDFWRILETNLYRKWTAFTGEPPSGPVTFTPDREYLRRGRANAWSSRPAAPSSGTWFPSPFRDRRSCCAWPTGPASAARTPSDSAWWRRQRAEKSGSRRKRKTCPPATAEGINRRGRNRPGQAGQKLVTGGSTPRPRARTNLDTLNRNAVPGKHNAQEKRGEIAPVAAVAYAAVPTRAVQTRAAQTRERRRRRASPGVSDSPSEALAFRRHHRDQGHGWGGRPLPGKETRPAGAPGLGDLRPCGSRGGRTSFGPALPPRHSAASFRGRMVPRQLDARLGRPLRTGNRSPIHRLRKP